AREWPGATTTPSCRARRQRRIDPAPDWTSQSPFQNPRLGASGKKGVRPLALGGQTPFFPDALMMMGAYSVIRLSVGRLQLGDGLLHIVDQNVGHVAAERLLDVHAHRVDALGVGRHAERGNDPAALRQRLDNVRGIVPALVLEAATAARRARSIVDNV